MQLNAMTCERYDEPTGGFECNSPRGLIGQALGHVRQVPRGALVLQQRRHAFLRCATSNFVEHQQVMLGELRDAGHHALD